ncbi:hypothetical protein [Tritonibacter scottomollicae]|uniref:hypothetical protein n=1 Tax=Tritonibacter scottomollicae TaxID=483013 RepID=UPI003AA98102
MTFLPEAPPDAPSTSQPATFQADADAFLAWMAGFATDIEEVGGLLEPGAFGLGDPGLSSITQDVFQSSASGIYYTVSSGSGGASDTPNPSSNWNILKFQRGDSYQAALLIHQAPNTPEAYFGVLQNGVKSAWARLFHSQNLLGSVAQSGGVPTGAVIERGSNANGDYVRYADGTQICWKVGPNQTTDTAVGVLYVNNSGWDWNFPSAFSGAPVVNASVRRVSGGHTHGAVIGSAALSSTACKLFVTATENGVTGVLHAVAFGRWF